MRWSEATDDGRAGETPAPGAAAGLALLLAACGMAWACARPGAPPGAPEETEPPGIRSLTPARDTVAPELSGRATVQFDEPISGASGLQRQLVASPAYPYSVSVGHSEISVRPEGGWRPGAVYVLELPGGISDLLNNAREEPIRMVFSTGPPVVPTRVTARLFDRVTGEERTEGRVLFLRARDEAGAGGAVASVGDTTASAEDTVPYTAVADTGAVYALEHLPPGDYWAYGFVDRNRNQRLDRGLEPYDSARIALDSDSAEASVRLFTLEPDSTPPVLGRVETPDSTTLRLGYDDHLRIGQTPERVLVRRKGARDSLPLREVRVLTAADTVQADTVPADTAAADTAAAAADSAAAAADSAATDSVAVPDTAAGDSVPVEPGGAARDTTVPRGAAGMAAPPTDTPETPPEGAEMPPRPTRILRVRLGEAMTVGDTYRVRVRGVANVWGLTSDADTTYVFTPPPPDTADADSAAAAADSAAADSAAAPPDTAVGGGALGGGTAEDTVPADTAGPSP